MTYVLLVIVIVLSGITTTSILWGLRRQAILRRLHRGIAVLSQGREPELLRRHPEDDEAVLAAFDQLSAQVTTERRIDAAEDRGRDFEVVLQRLIAMLRQPLIAIQSYAVLVRQAPEIPTAGDTHDLVQKLNFQITGLLRLFEASTDVSKLRAAISGLERDIAGVSTGQPTRTVLVIDEEGPWSKHIADTLRVLRLHVLDAPGADAVAIMVRAIPPRAIIVNASRPDGLGWRSLQILRRERRLLSVPILLYRVAPGGELASLWAPQDIWFWPLPNNDDSRIVRQRVRSDNLRYSLHGNLELATEVSRWLGSAGIPIEPMDRDSDLVLDGCVTLSMHPAEPSPGVGSEFVLIVPSRMVTTELDRLTRSVDRQGEKSPLRLADWDRTLLESLRPVAEEMVEEPA